MSSSGGFFSSSYDPDQLRVQIRDSEKKTANQNYEVQVETEIATALVQYNDRDTEGLHKILDNVIKDLGAEIDGAAEVLFGGSVAKHTYVDGLSDVDALVMFPPTEDLSRSPEELKQLLADLMTARYGKEVISVGRLAVTLTMKEGTLQLLPALKTPSGIKIASSDGTAWSKINPQRFTDALTKANADLSGKLIPTIKLVKGIVGGQPEPRRITGYHTEALALKIFNGYSGPKTPKAMLQYFFENAREHLMRPIVDKTGQSVHVDKYLGNAEDVRRKVIADAFDRIARIMKNADGAASVERWKELLTVDQNDAN